jgi:hypothetical protein
MDVHDPDASFPNAASALQIRRRLDQPKRFTETRLRDH